jgi:hypothetical protein
MQDQIDQQNADNGVDAWLDEVVTDEAKKDPDWRNKAKSGRGSLIPAGCKDELPFAQCDSPSS